MVCMVFHRSYQNTGGPKSSLLPTLCRALSSPKLLLWSWKGDTFCAHSTPKTARLPAVSFVCRWCTKSVVLAVCWLLLPVLLFVSQPAPEQSRVLMYKTLKWNWMFKTLKCWLQLLSVLFTLRLFHSSPVPGQLHGLLWPTCKPIIICIQ